MSAKTAQAFEQLARVKDPAARGQLAMGVTDLCTANPLAPETEPVAGELLITLVDKADLPVRVKVAEKLASCAWSPQNVVVHLASDQIEVAALLIRKSPRLSDDDLVVLAQNGTPDHRFHIAARPNIALVVTNKLAEPAEPPVLRALANNDTAEISDETIETCLTAARDNPKLREALARRHDLSTDHAMRLCLMLPEHWQEELTRRFGLNKEEIEKKAISTALESATEDQDKAAADRVQGMIDEGKLTGMWAINALKAGEEVVFDHAIAKLNKVTVPQWRVGLAMGGVRAAALACHGADLDRTAYPVVHRALQRSGRLHQVLEGDAMAAAANIFRMYTTEKAQKALRQLGGRV